MTAPQTVADVLDAAATRLEQPGAWAQGDFAFTADKKGTYGENESAVCWCALGAIAYELRDKGGTSSGYYDAAANELQHHVGDVPDFNDAPGRTQSEVVAALRAAATSARQGETK